MCVPGCKETVHRTLSRRGLFKSAAATVAGYAAVNVTSAAAQAPLSKKVFSSVIDLTHTMSPEFPIFLGMPGVELQQQTDFKKDGFTSYWWRLFEHAGTHVDAPIHFSENGATSEQIPADTLVAPLAVIDVTEKAARDPDYAVSRQDLMDWEAKNGRLPDNCCVAMHSGWARYANDPAKFLGKDSSGVFHFPGFAGEAAEWLMRERQVVGIAVDTLSLDPGRSKDFNVHLAWLPSGRWGIENVTNLDRAPAAGATVVVGLAKIKGATGGAARVLALV